MKLFSLESEELEVPERAEGSIEVTEDNFDDCVDYLREQELELTHEIEDTQKVLIAVEAINNMIKVKEAGLNPIALESFRYASEMAVVGTMANPNMLLNTNLSLEALASQRDSFLGRLGHAFKSIGQKYADYVHYFYSILDFQTARLKKLSKAIDAHDGDKKTIKLAVNKWMSYGLHPTPVKTSSEYLSEFQKVTKVVVPLSKGLNSLADEDVFGWFKWIKAIVTGDTDRFIQERGEQLQNHLGALAKNTGMKQEKELNGLVLHASDVMLGLFQIEVTVPNKKITIAEDIKNHCYNVHIERMSKFNLPDFAKDSYSLEFDKKEIQALLKSATELLAEAKKLGSLGNRVAQIGTTMSITNTFTPAGLVSTYVGLLTQSGVLAMHVSAIILATMSATHNVAFGNVKQAARITEKYLK